MNLNYVQIKLLAQQLNTLCAGALVNKIKKGLGKEIVFELYQEKQKKYLVLGLNPQYVSCHLAPKEHLQFFLPNSLTLFLRKHFHRRPLIKIESFPNERIITLFFKGKHQLILILIPKNPNLLVVDDNNNILLSLSPYPQKIFTLSDSSTPLEDDYQPTLPSLQEIAHNYDESFKKNWLHALKNKKLKALQKQLKKTESTLIKMQKDYQNCLKHEKFLVDGNLILSSSYNLSLKGKEFIEVFDYEGNKKTLVLQAHQSLAKNAQNFFNKAKKLKKALPILEERILKKEEEKEGILKAIQELNQNNLEEMKDFIKEEKKGKLEKILKKTPFLVYQNSLGNRFLVGRNAEENDAIYKVARGRDYWFHCRDYPGAHVLLWNESNQKPPQESLKDGATLALLYSKLKKEKEGFVMVSLRKYLSRMPKMAKGQVSVSRYQSLWVKIDEKQLVRLKKQS